MKHKEESHNETDPKDLNETNPNSEHCCCGSCDCSSNEQAAEDMSVEEQALDLSDIVAKLDEATAAAERNKDLYLRSVADLDTYRRKVLREKQELAKFALQPLIEEVLPSLDHLEMAIEAARTSSESPNLLQGVEMVYSQLKKTLAAFGVEEVAANGKDFDPNTSECVSHEPSDSVAENTVMKVVRTGYVYNGRLIRPASVVVSSGKPKA